MDGDNLARLIYLVLLGSVIAGYFFAQNRNNLGKTAQQAAVWGLIFTVLREKVTGNHTAE